MNAVHEIPADANVATMSLVVFFEDAVIGALARERIAMLASKHPSRIIVFDATKPQSSPREESADWFEVGAKGSDAQTLRSTAGSLRLAEVPAVLLWIAPAIGDERFTMLAEGVQTVVYNSSLLDIGYGALCDLVAYVDRHPELPLADIAYLRLAPWQESVAIFFDGKDLDELRDLQRVEIGCGSDPEAYYLLGWLASRLGWKPIGAAALVSRAGKRITFDIRREGEPRRIARVALSSSYSTFVAEVATNGETISLSVTGSSAHPRRYRAIGNPGIAALVERAILWGRQDRIFNGALAAAGAILARREG